VQGNGSAALARPGSASSSSLLLGAFHLEGWINWLRTGKHYPAAASSMPASLVAMSAANGMRSEPLASEAASLQPPLELDIHRMNQAQARVTVLQQLAALATAVPAAEVQRMKNEILEGRPPACVHCVVDSFIWFAVGNNGRMHVYGWPCAECAGVISAPPA
jgi:hypothetical protein